MRAAGSLHPGGPVILRIRVRDVQNYGRRPPIFMPNMGVGRALTSPGREERLFVTTQAPAANALLPKCGPQLRLDRAEPFGPERLEPTGKEVGRLFRRHAG